MPMIEYHTVLNEEDLGRLKLYDSRKEALEVNPAAYSSRETEEILLGYKQLLSSFLAKYEIDDRRNWSISPLSGIIVYIEQ